MHLDHHPLVHHCRRSIFRMSATTVVVSKNAPHERTAMSMPLDNGLADSPGPFDSRIISQSTWDIGKCYFVLDRGCGVVAGPHTRHLGMVLAEQKRRKNMKGDCLRLGAYLAGLGLANPVDSCYHSLSRVPGSWVLVCICSCRAHTGHPQEAAPGGWFWMCISASENAIQFES
jgi:hypothetical protein